MNNKTHIIIHCSDSDYEHHDNVETLRKWHVEERGWRDVGYHFIITKDGEIHQSRNVIDNGSHAKGYNKKGIGICLTGKFNFSDQQFVSLYRLVFSLQVIFKIQYENILPHSAVSNKTCPNFKIWDNISKYY